MANKTKFEVLSCNANKNGGYVWKVAVKAVSVIFGVTKTSKKTYYVGGMPQQVAIGATFDEDMDRLMIVQRPFTPMENGKPKLDENGKEIVIMLNWLHVK